MTAVGFSAVEASDEPDAMATCVVEFELVVDVGVLELATGVQIGTVDGAAAIDAATE